MSAHDKRRKQAQIYLRCGHAPYFSTPLPIVGEIIWCVRCLKETEVMESQPPFSGWTWNCLDVDCVRAAPTQYGDTESDKRRVWRAAQRHYRRGHDVQVTHDGKRVHVWEHASDQGLW